MRPLIDAYCRAKESTGKNGKGIVGVRAVHDPNDTLDTHTRLVDESANREAAATKKHPLRIDIRHNNPEQETVERLLESTEFGSRVGYHDVDVKPKNTMATTAAYTTNYDNFAETLPTTVETRQQFGNYTTVASPHPAQTARMFESSSQPFLSTPDERRRRYEGGDTRLSGAALTRPHTASADSVMPSKGTSGAGIRRPMSSSGLGGRDKEVSALKTSSPFMNSHRAGNGGGLLPELGSDSDEEQLYGGDNDDEGDGQGHGRAQFVSSRLAEKRRERVEGTAGTAVGSLLDNEIRRMQADRTTDPSMGYAEGVGRKKRPKSAKRATSAAKDSNDLPAPSAERHLGMRNVYNNPVVRLTGGKPTSASSTPKPFTHRTDTTALTTPGKKQEVNKTKGNAKLLVSKNASASLKRTKSAGIRTVKAYTVPSNASYSHLNPGMLF